ncbi:MAG: branched-chain amino acid transporter substrate-binding protein [Deltaproteobacteria bacterium]|nr:branched-chain amino acid transporter substrate-binding protein [Deltaproteobacteria bacterium]
MTSLSGVNAPGVMVTSGNVYKMWVEEVNADGGLFIKEYGKKLPLDVTMYDDKSDIGTMTKLLEKTIVEDKVDWIFSPWDTAFLFAAAPIANKHKVVLMGGSGGALKLKGVISKYPYYFQVLNFADYHIPAIGDVFKEVGVKSVYIAYIQDLHGLEYNEVAQKEFPKMGIKIVAAKSFPLDMQDFTPLMKEAKAANVDGFMGFLYPQNAFPATGQAMEVGFSPKAFYMTVGPCLAGYRDAFTAKGINGVMGAGAWSVKTSAGAKEFFDKYTKRWGFEPEGWGALFYYSSLQFLKQAIEEAGTLNQTKIRDIMASKTYPTALGPFKFTKNIFIDHPGEVGQWQNGTWEIIDQWQNGTWEIIDVGKKRTAKPMYPKPAWQPPPPPKKK